MKKKINVLCGLALFVLLFIYTNVQAAEKCSYIWNNEPIILEKRDSSNNYDVVKANIKISIAKNNIIESTSDTCPTIYIFQEYFGNPKIYSSKPDYRESEGECMEVVGTKIENISSESVLGKSQAALVKKEASYCEYVGEGGHTFKIQVSGNDMEFTCSSDNSYRCVLQKNRPYFYGGGDNLKCPTYIYYDCTQHMPIYQCEIIGVGGEADSNTSGIENPVKGDNLNPVNPSLIIETSPLNCDGIFQGEFGDFLRDIWKLLKFAVPILIIVFSIVDFIKSISAHDEAEVKKAVNKLVKRLIIGVLVFVLPTIIELLLHLAGIEYGTCNIK